MSALIKRLFKGNEDKYPKNLEEKFGRILEKITKLWGTEELEKYISELMIDDKGDRQGFPPEVVSELFALSMVHDEYLIAMQAHASDPWANEKVKAELSELNIEYSPKGLFSAVDAGNERAVQLFVEAGVNLDEQNQTGWTVLMISSFMGSERTAEILINAGANVNAKDHRGYGPLHWAAYKGFLKICQMLVDRGAYVNALSEKGISPLLQAAACGHKAIVDLLLSKRALPNEADSEGWTPLHKAVANNHVEVVRSLMRSRADPVLVHASGLTPIQIAKQKGYKDILEILTRNTHKS